MAGRCKEEKFFEKWLSNHGRSLQLTTDSYTLVRLGLEHAAVVERCAILVYFERWPIFFAKYSVLLGLRLNHHAKLSNKETF